MYEISQLITTMKYLFIEVVVIAIGFYIYYRYCLWRIKNDNRNRH